jgi:hypothetical protein
MSAAKIERWTPKLAEKLAEVHRFAFAQAFMALGRTPPTSDAAN